jgi:hypothetical protein
MSTSEWIAVVATLQTFAMMVAGFYVWSAGRRNVDMDSRFRLFKAELESEWKDRMKDDRHALRVEMQTFVSKLQGELDEEIDDLKKDIDELSSRLERGGRALRPKTP